LRFFGGREDEVALASSAMANPVKAARNTAIAPTLTVIFIGDSSGLDPGTKLPRQSGNRGQI